MSYIYNVGRIELSEQVKKHSHFIKGCVLDVGAGNFSRYNHLFNFDKYVKMNIGPGKNTDVVGRAEEIPFPSDTFDSIVCTQVLGDVYELPQAFKEFYRVLKPGSVALITENLFDPLHGEPYDFWRFTDYSLGRLAEDAGFKVELIERRGAYHSVIAQLKARYWIERLNPSHKWYARLFNLSLRISGNLAQWQDSHDKSKAGRLFVRGYILIIRKSNLK